MKKLLAVMMLVPMVALADKETVNGVEWTCVVKGGKAEIVAGLSTKTKGAITIPSALDVAKFNAQFANTLTVKTSRAFHDRFIILDNAMLLDVGASLNYIGKRCFAFSSMDASNIPDILARLYAT